MSPLIIGLLVFGFTSVGFLLGMWAAYKLPEHHLTNDSRETVKLGIGLVATITALVLGLITASVKSNFDDLNEGVKRSAAQVLTIDRNLARYGPETQPIREHLREAVGQRLDSTWPKNSSLRASLDPVTGGERVADEIRRLSPQNDDQRWLKSRAMEMVENILNERWMLIAGSGSSVPKPFLAILVFWLTVTFGCFGVFAPRNPTVIAILLVCTLSVAFAMFLILEMDGPFDGLIRISPEPLRYAYARIAQ